MKFSLKTAEERNNKVGGMSVPLSMLHILANKLHMDYQKIELALSSTLYLKESFNNNKDLFTSLNIDIDIVDIEKCIYQKDCSNLQNIIGNKKKEI